MIKHIIMWKLKEENREANAIEMAKRLNALQGKAEGLHSIEAGVNFTESDRSFDVALFTAFETMEDMDKYKVDKEHQKVIKFIREVSEKSVLVDYVM